ncbi:hypothetical protein M5K25_007751 [Dendrobium thyrsiflorum]|uniref:RRM domain-containing protein n=1 Tax=Dendrobium thyrsiflorum TaxID=117978 RepID=A0ABD0VF29_DENTH
MATVLNPHAPVFFPNATAAVDELSIIYPPCRLLPPQTFPAFIPQRYDHSCISKSAILFHPSLIYYHHASPSCFPNFSYYIPPPKYSITTIIEPERAEVSGAVPRLVDELAGVEERRFPIEAKAMDEPSMRTVSSSRFSIRGFRGRYGCRQLIKRNSQLWVPKSSSSFDSPQEAAFPPPVDSQFCEGAKSTVMIKNIPNKISRKQLLDLLDQHCRVQNQKINKEDGSDTPSSEFDFLYLPMDFISGNNLGYAFVNFTSSVAAKRLYQDMHLMPWNTFGSRKICEITHAKIQAKLVKHFRRSLFTCSSTEYLPVYFQPSRDGSRDSAEQLVGKLAQLSLS